LRSLGGVCISLRVGIKLVFCCRLRFEFGLLNFCGIELGFLCGLYLFRDNRSDRKRGGSFVEVFFTRQQRPQALFEGLCNRRSFALLICHV